MPRSLEFDQQEKLVKARDTFWEKGYHGTSITDLGRSMDLNPGSIYNTYGSKHQLFVQCLCNYIECNFAHYPRMEFSDQSPIAAITHIIYSIADKMADGHHACMIGKSSFELCEADKEVRALLRNNNDALAGLFRQLLAKAQEAGEITPDKDPGVLSQLIVASFSGLGQHYVLYQDKEQLHALAAQLIRLLKA
ncbi:MAG TPA: TetR/AcrR family transcriptional regulator [Chitinophaga sp.]|uniref:TetR/AcrR family transcriptional regulator n=1 Tax=Chitinophaga sp. TaxID=1869181 RepID=UPI002DB88972|nr:TetR/AcrR family transcriptional regulator [Chitinophaga sp.]HEU4555222.1 TetR/AcrR family transcriptional regulator [Chitinophaga sp.]